MRRLKEYKKGFTIIELAITIAIIAILAGVAGLTYVGFSEGSKVNRSKQEAESLYNQMRMAIDLDEEFEPGNRVKLTDNGFSIKFYNSNTISRFFFDALPTGYNSPYTVLAWENPDTLKDRPINSSASIYFFASEEDNVRSTVRYMAYLPAGFTSKYYTYIDLSNGKEVSYISGDAFMKPNARKSIIVSQNESSKDSIYDFELRKDSPSSELVGKVDYLENPFQSVTSKLDVNYKLGATPRLGGNGFKIFNDVDVKAQRYATGNLKVRIEGSQDIIDQLEVSALDENHENVFINTPYVAGYNIGSYFDTAKRSDNTKVNQLVKTPDTVGFKEYSGNFTVDTLSYDQKVKFTIGLKDNIEADVLRKIQTEGFNISLTWGATTDFDYAYIKADILQNDGTFYHTYNENKFDPILRLQPDITKEKFTWSYQDLPIKIGDNFTVGMRVNDDLICANGVKNWVATNWNGLHPVGQGILPYDITWEGPNTVMAVNPPDADETIYQKDNINITLNFNSLNTNSSIFEIHYSLFNDLSEDNLTKDQVKLNKERQIVLNVARDKFNFIWLRFFMQSTAVTCETSEVHGKNIKGCRLENFKNDVTLNVMLKNKKVIYFEEAK